MKEIRLRHGKADDIVLSNVDVHLEQMDNKVWWLGVYSPGAKLKRNTFWIRYEKGQIIVHPDENGLKAKVLEQEDKQ